MNKRILLFLIICLIFPALVFSIKTFVIQETEKISLQANATDPDNDRLTTTYGVPLDENGEWQTTYGDAGEYKATVTVSDGTTDVSQDVLIIVKKKEEIPKIESFAPEQDTLDIKETESIDFKVSASDINKDELNYQWSLDNKKVKEGQEFTYATAYGDAGTHEISILVSDGAKETSKEWTVNVEKVDLESLLDSIPDAIFNENEIVKLQLPDFEKYGLTYSISEPVGNKNEWKTNYEDSGTYSVEVHAEGKGFSGDELVEVVVNDVDRAPVFDKIENKVINENEELTITLHANDPDGDEVAYSADNLPADAKLEENVFTWKPSYDTVKKEGFVDKIIDKFGVLSKSFYVQFIASSEDKKVVQNVIITVKDVNRVPVLEDMEPINISEEETLRILPKAYDPDGDKISLAYFGFIKTDTYKSKFGDAGTYDIKVTATDGLLEASKFVRINIKHVNRAPVFGEMQDIKASENDNIALLLNADDPDGDEVAYFIDNPPEGSSLKENAFFWTPNYSLAAAKETKRVDLVFVASDGRAETKQVTKAEIMRKNTAPRIINSTKSAIARVDEPVLMFVEAVDDDGDELTYTWDFGLFETYKATPLHQRIFTSPGAKTVKVVVSDGVEETEQIITVVVI